MLEWIPATDCRRRRGSGHGRGCARSVREATSSAPSTRCATTAQASTAVISSTEKLRPLAAFRLAARPMWSRRRSGSRCSPTIRIRGSIRGGRTASGVHGPGANRRSVKTEERFGKAPRRRCVCEPAPASGSAAARSRRSVGRIAAARSPSGRLNEWRQECPLASRGVAPSAPRS